MTKKLTTSASGLRCRNTTVVSWGSIQPTHYAVPTGESRMRNGREEVKVWCHWCAYSYWSRSKKAISFLRDQSRRESMSRLGYGTASERMTRFLNEEAEKNMGTTR